ncbi:MAG TPA: FHA domain-containing protein [Vicinamibacteria bacterium]|nr:FHA domain-containing protein [Vicinamibacteria bacterium]
MRVQFGEFGLDTGRRRLLRGQEPVHLSPKAHDLLRVLLEARPRTVPKADLMAALWPDAAVTDGNLAVLVSEVRAALGDAADAPRFVRTEHGRGYAFCGHTDSSSEAGSARAWLVWEGGRAALTEGEHILGRAPEALVSLSAPGVSRRHARLRVTDKRIVLEDLGSKNGTYVQGVRVGSPVVLSDGDHIRLGSMLAWLRLTIPQAPDTDTGA